MLYRLRFVPFLVVFLLLGCAPHIKYPSKSAIYYEQATIGKRKQYKKKQAHLKKVKKIYIHKTKKSVVIGNCQEGIVYYSKFETNIAKICLGYYYFECGKLYKSKKILTDLEKKQLTNKQFGQVYALLGLIQVERRFSGRNYFELSYAYDSNNRVATYMLNTSKPSLRFAKQLAREWCIHGY